MPESKEKLSIYTPSQIEAVAVLGLVEPSEETSVWFPIPEEGGVNYASRIDVNEIKITPQYVEALEDYLDGALEDFTGFSQERCKGFVVALSGGLDSAVTAKLLQDYCNKKGKELKIIIIGSGNHNGNSEEYGGTVGEWIDIQYAKLFCQDLDLDFEYVDIESEYSASSKRYSETWAKSGQLPRIRANHLYTMAEEHDLISVGSTNGTEVILAAFSTGGPAGNIAPLVDLYKTEVYALARDIGVPQYIIDRKPLISELNTADDSFYGVDSALLDPILRRLWYKKQEPSQVAEELGHSESWINDINEKRIKGESARRYYQPLIINRPLKYKDIDPDLNIDRSYFL